MKSNRRNFLQTLGAGTAGLGLAGLPGSATATPLPPAEEDGQVLFIGDNMAVADTRHGKVRGFILRGIYTYLGIPYGADTAGENRFMPPQKPAPWKDVKPAIWWGNSAPQNMDKRYANDHYAFSDHWNYDDLSEDCLRLNVWTPGVNDNKKRPVVVWLHGGGFVNGNGIEQDGYHGENLSRRGDVVFLSLNHRLGPMGFANFAAAGSKYAASGNVGMLDIVAALEWVRDNIAGFGGDPGNVTIIGQSGGGVKVSTLTAMPAAKGLFHKAVVLSGASLRAADKETSERLGAYILKEAGLTPEGADKLQQLPWQEYYDIAGRASRKLSDELRAAGKRGRQLGTGGRRRAPAAAPLRPGAHAPGGGHSDAHLQHVPRVFAQPRRRQPRKHYPRRGEGEVEGTVRGQRRASGRCLRGGISREEARRNLVDGPQQPAETRWPWPAPKPNNRLLCTWRGSAGSRPCSTTGCGPFIAATSASGSTTLT
jgi:hypothetical protein